MHVQTLIAGTPVKRLNKGIFHGLTRSNEVELDASPIGPVFQGTRLELRPMIDRLSPEYREAIRLVELEGLTNQEAAAKLGLSVPGMKSRVQRGRQQIRKMLDECCLIELDRRRGVVEFEERWPGSC